MADQPNPDPARPLRVLVSAGEASGDTYGAGLIRALRAALIHQKKIQPENAAAHAGALDCFGLAGERMVEAGCEAIVAAREVAVVGLFEVASHLPKIYRKFHRLLDEVDRLKPDVAVLIDFPDWNLRLARELDRRGIPVVYYVSPQLWAWRRGRIRQVRRYVGRMLVIFPFEREFYQRHGIDAEFVGHPLAELAPPEVTREEFARRHGLNAAKPWIALLPGSRRKELRMNLPAMLGAAARLGPEYEYLLPVASTLDEAWVRGEVAACAPAQETPLAITLTSDARASLLHARAAVVASGTATVEAALIGTPFVMVYRLGRLTWALGRHLVKLPHYGMVNLIAGRRLVPELVQDGFSAESVVRKLQPLLTDGPARQAMLSGLAEVRHRLRGENLDSAQADSSAPMNSQSGAARPSAAERAARAVLRVAESRSRGRE